MEKIFQKLFKKNSLASHMKKGGSGGEGGEEQVVSLHVNDMFTFIEASKKGAGCIYSTNFDKGDVVIK